MTRIIVAMFLAATAAAAQTPGPVPDGMPFGHVGDADVDRLYEFALSGGFDLKAEMARVYCCDKKIDEDALARVFVFSRRFNTLDKNARTYGQIIYSSLLRIGEVLGVDYYVRIIARQPPDVQQRVRDFLYYPMLRVPTEQRKQVEEENSKMYPTLFPKSFQFGHDDPIFAKET
jgi:hypothetical protein